MLYVVAAVLVLVAVFLAVPMLRRGHHLDEVDRFHVARSLTSNWASEPQPPVHIPAPGDPYEAE